MSKTIQAIRGMNDLLPEVTPYWHRLESVLKDTVASYGYQEIRTPVVESTSLFKRAVGEVTDIVEKEMYTFEDRNGDSLSLRPESTASCVRAGIQHGLFYNQLQRLWYLGPQFRHERPQKGRYRQFFQFGAEAFGYANPEMDAELILLGARIWKALGLESFIRLELNSLGDADTRVRYREQLIAYFTQHLAILDEDSTRRLQSNPLRILDSKNPALKEIIQQAPKLLDVLDDESKQHFQQLCAHLDAAGLEYVINPCLVRGLDYYNRTVFEWVTEHLGAQGTVCAGGRYDGLVEQLGGKPATAVGFAMGLERVVAMMMDMAKEQNTVSKPCVYVMAVGEAGQQASLAWVEKLRDQLPELHLINDNVGGNLKKQLKRADKSAAQYGLIMAEQELAEQQVIMKDLRTDGTQQTVPLEQIAEVLRTKCLGDGQT